MHWQYQQQDLLLPEEILSLDKQVNSPGRIGPAVDIVLQKIGVSWKIKTDNVGCSLEKWL